MSVHKSRGFTVVELITVIVIVGVLAAIAVPGFRNLRINSQISSYSGDMAMSLNLARSTAVSTRDPVFLVQGPGESDSDIEPSDDWAAGWRVVRGVDAAAEVISRVTRAGKLTDVKVFVRSGGVDEAGNAAGAEVEGLGFNNFGQLITLERAALPQASVVICSDDSRVTESGRAIAVSRIGRVSNNTVSNPPCGT